MNLLSEDMTAQPSEALGFLHLKRVELTAKFGSPCVPTQDLHKTSLCMMLLKQFSLV